MSSPAILTKSVCPQVLSFNLGSLGFLTNHYWANFKKDVSNVIHGCERLDHCMLDDPGVGPLTLLLTLAQLCRNPACSLANSVVPGDSSLSTITLLPHPVRLWPMHLQLEHVRVPASWRLPHTTDSPGTVMQSMGVHITLRMRLECKILRANARDDPEPVEVLNEVVVDRGSGPYLTKIECWERDHLITKVSPGTVLCICASM